MTYWFLIYQEIRNVSFPPSTSSKHTNALHMAVIVIKIGTSSICNEQSQYPQLANLSLLVETVIQLREEGGYRGGGIVWCWWW